MRYGGSKLKKPEKCDFCGIFYHLNGVKFYKPHWVEIRHVISEIFNPKHHYFPFLQNVLGHNEPKFLKF